MQGRGRVAGAIRGPAPTLFFLCGNAFSLYTHFFSLRLSATFGIIQVNLSSALTYTQIVAFFPITQSHAPNPLIACHLLWLNVSVTLITEEGTTNRKICSYIRGKMSYSENNLALLRNFSHHRIAWIHSQITLRKCLARFIYLLNVCAKSHCIITMKGWDGFNRYGHNLFIFGVFFASTWRIGIMLLDFCPAMHSY